MSRRNQLVFESLEKRHLLSASNILIEDGLLGFRGTNADDVMQVEHIGNQYKLTLNGQYAFINDVGPLRGVVVDGRAGNDQITIGSSVTVLTGVLGGKGNDIIHGGGGENYLFGEAGNDTIFSGPQGSSNNIGGGAGDDTIHCGVGATEAHGDKGNDTLYGENTSATLYGDAGNDFLYVGTDGSTLYGGAGNDELSGADSTRTDTLYGGAGNDILRGRRDVIFGEAGNDTIYGVDDGNRCSGGKGNDTVYGGPGKDEIFGDEGRDQLFGALGDDTIHGGAGNDLLQGGAGADWLYGEDGNDAVNGDEDADIIDGGVGNDICRGGAGDDWITGGVGRNLLDGEGGNNLLSPTGAAETLLNGIQTSVPYNLYVPLSPYAIGHAAYAMSNAGGVLAYKLTLNFYVLPYHAGTHDILVDGIKVGEVTSVDNAPAFVDTVLSTNPTGSEQSFPAGFPGIHEGSTLQIVDLASGVFTALPYGSLD